MSGASDIAKALGPGAVPLLAECCGKSEKTIANAIARGRFSARQLAGVAVACQRRGVKAIPLAAFELDRCPRDLWVSIPDADPL